MGTREIRAGVERPVVARERFRDPVERKEGVAAVAERVGAAGRDGERLVETYQRVGETAEFAKEAAAIAERRGKTRLNGERQVVACKRFRPPPKPDERIAFVGQGADVSPVERQRAVIAGDGLLQPTDGGVSGPKLAPCAGVLGRSASRRIEPLKRVRIASPLQQQPPVGPHGLPILRLSDQEGLVELLGLIEFALAMAFGRRLEKQRPLRAGGARDRPLVHGTPLAKADGIGGWRAGAH